jgi:hypothetical protein
MGEGREGGAAGDGGKHLHLHAADRDAAHGHRRCHTIRLLRVAVALPPSGLPSRADAPRHSTLACAVTDARFCFRDLLRRVAGLRRVSLQCECVSDGPH